MIDVDRPLLLTENALLDLNTWYRLWDRDMARHPHRQLNRLLPDTVTEPDPYQIECCGRGRARIIIPSPLVICTILTWFCSYYPYGLVS